MAKPQLIQPEADQIYRALMYELTVWTEQFIEIRSSRHPLKLLSLL